MKKKKRFIKIAIDSPAAAGAGTLAKSLSCTCYAQNKISKKI